MNLHAHWLANRRSTLSHNALECGVPPGVPCGVPPGVPAGTPCGVPWSSAWFPVVSRVVARDVPSGVPWSRLVPHGVPTVVQPRHVACAHVRTSKLPRDGRQQSMCRPRSGRALPAARYSLGDTALATHSVGHDVVNQLLPQPARRRGIEANGAALDEARNHVQQADKVRAHPKQQGQRVCPRYELAGHGVVYSHLGPL